MIHIVELASIAPQPWRNGGGVTRELLTWPPGAGADWLLRVSVADIERDGPFSAFPGVQRCFAVLEGAGVVLGFAEGERTLTPGSPPLAFEGAAAPACRLLDGPTRDLNLMARLAAVRAQMRPVVVGEAWPATAGWHGVYTVSPLSLRAGTGEPLALPAHSLAWGEAPGDAWALTAASGAAPRAWWLGLLPAGAAA